jgi:SagB-type dehydrogenase family enzyme
MTRRAVLVNFDGDLDSARSAWFDTAVGSEVLVDGDSLAALVAVDETAFDAHLQDIAMREGDEYFDPTNWIAHNWTPSLFHHAAALNQRYVDCNDKTGKLREAVLAQYGNDLDLKQIPVGNRVALPPPDVFDPTQTQMQELLLGRRTHRRFRATSASNAALSNVLFHGCQNMRVARLNAAKHPRGELISFGSGIELFTVVQNVEGIQPSVYHYNLEEHHLSSLGEQVEQNIIIRLFNGQPYAKSSAFLILMVLYFGQASWRYRHEKGLTNQLVEIGRIAQDLIFQGERAGLGSFMTPAIKETVGASLCHLNVLEACPLYALAMGVK